MSHSSASRSRAASRAAGGGGRLSRPLSSVDLLQRVVAEEDSEQVRMMDGDGHLAIDLSRPELDERKLPGGPHGSRSPDSGGSTPLPPPTPSILRLEQTDPEAGARVCLVINLLVHWFFVCFCGVHSFVCVCDPVHVARFFC